jgi:hypothetical protein
MAALAQSPRTRGARPGAIVYKLERRHGFVDGKRDRAASGDAAGFGRARGARFKRSAEIHDLRLLALNAPPQKDEAGNAQRGVDGHENE